MPPTATTLKRDIVFIEEKASQALSDLDNVLRQKKLPKEFRELLLGVRNNIFHAAHEATLIGPKLHMMSCLVGNSVVATEQTVKPVVVREHTRIRPLRVG